MGSLRPMAMPPMMRAVAASSATVSGSPSAIDEQITPTIGTASNPSGVEPSRSRFDGQRDAASAQPRSLPSLSGRRSMSLFPGEP